MTPEQLASIKRYVGFGDDATAALREFHPTARPHFGNIVEDFYAAIEAHPEAVAVITGGGAQVERLKQTLKAWMDSVLSGPYDDAYLAQHSRIGRVHVRINLPQQYMFTAMNRIRSHLLRVADESLEPGSERHARVKEALNQVLDLELAIMLDTYREDLVEKMRVAERLATLGQLSATIAHELRNPLGTIETSLFLLRKRLDKLGIEDDVLDRHHAKISTQVSECGTTIHNLLDLARDRPLKRRAIDPRQLVDGACSAVDIPERIRIETEVHDGVRLHGDADQLRQVLANLIRNAVEAIRGTGRILIRAVSSDRGVELHVSDDGPGIPGELRHQVFEVLFTTKATGTGLGLALARRVAEAHGGTVELLPSSGGAHFRIIIPHEEPIG